MRAAQLQRALAHVSPYEWANDSRKFDTAARWFDSEWDLIDAALELDQRHAHFLCESHQEGPRQHLMKDMAAVFAQALDDVIAALNDARTAAIQDLECGEQDDDAAQDEADFFNRELELSAPNVADVLRGAGSRFVRPETVQ